MEVSGTYADVGRAIGKKMGEQIRKIVAEVKMETKNYGDYLTKTKPYFDLTKKIFPNLVVEMEAIAEAAGVLREDYFFINNREVYDAAEAWDKEDATNLDHCTIAVSMSENRAIVGHNEDWSISVIDSMYVLKATVGGTRILGLNYAAAVPGVAASMNSWGVVQCINDLHQTAEMGVPKNFLARAVLECRTLDEAEKLVRETPKGSGFNHVLVQNGEVRNFEIAGQQVAVQKKRDGNFVHTNHYLTSEMQKLEKFHTKSSEVRYKRAMELVRPNMTKEEMAALLSDSENKEYPICRPDETVGSLVFQPINGQVDVCYGHPCAGKFNSYNLNG